MVTGFFSDERCFWHHGGNYALTMPVGGFVQPLVAGGLPESPETKRRLKNLLEVSGLLQELQVQSAEPVSFEQLARVHTESYLKAFKKKSDEGGGELGLRTPFGAGGYEVCALAAGLATTALHQVLSGKLDNAYALSRPPGHHALPDFPNGFCLINNIAVAIEEARHQGLAKKFVVLDWDVHHGNGTEAIFFDRPDVLTISIHQDRNYPMDTGQPDVRGKDAGHGFNLNLPLPPGAGHYAYMQVMERFVIPQIQSFQPDVILVACGFDASAMDPLSRTLATAETFARMTAMVMDVAEQVCNGRLVMVHEGGYSEAHVPFCGHAVISQLAKSSIDVPDPLAETLRLRQPDPRFDRFVDTWLDDIEAVLAPEKS
ncbi:MAG: class II histone deacetylase [Alphaproteobacteria bacterium]|nr:class II histone deacetylase [Alphaproteobacteria bacterium]